VSWRRAGAQAIVDAATQRGVNLAQIASLSKLEGLYRH
jgi:hypothetical protein